MLKGRAGVSPKSALTISNAATFPRTAFIHESWALRHYRERVETPHCRQFEQRRLRPVFNEPYLSSPLFAVYITASCSHDESPSWMHCLRFVSPTNLFAGTGGLLFLFFFFSFTSRAVAAMVTTYGGGHFSSIM